MILFLKKPEHVETMMDKLDDGVKDEKKEKEAAAQGHRWTSGTLSAQFT